MGKSIKDLNKVTVRYAIGGDDFEEYHIDGYFKDGQKYIVAVFDDTCEGIADEVAAMINDKLKMNKKADKLQNALKIKLHKVQKLVIKKILEGNEIVFEISSHSGAATLHGINGIVCGNKYYSAMLEPYEYMRKDNERICKFYKEQHAVVDHWIKILS
jgi:hypothetical protein